MNGPQHYNAAEQLLGEIIGQRDVAAHYLPKERRGLIEAIELDLKAAHVHAMLAVAEQQSIRNLIALVSANGVTERTTDVGFAGYPEMLAYIRDELGLNEPVSTAPTTTTDEPAVNIVLAPTDPAGPDLYFIDVEYDDGTALSLGTHIPRPDGNVNIRITPADLARALQRKEN